jgi:hypothetical protein
MNCRRVPSLASDAARPRLALLLALGARRGQRGRDLRVGRGQRLGVGRVKLDGDRVDAVARVGGVAKALAAKLVAHVAATRCAHNFDASHAARRVDVARDGAGHLQGGERSAKE